MKPSKSTTNPTRRGFFRSTGLVLGAAIVAPGVLASGLIQGKGGNPGDILCKGCGGKLYDAERHLKYHFEYWPISDTLKVSGPNGSGLKCVHCGYLSSWVTGQTWPQAAHTAPEDIQVFDDMADERNIVPPTVQARFDVRIDKLEKPEWTRDACKAYGLRIQAAFDDEMDIWRRERAALGLAGC